VDSPSKRDSAEARKMLKNAGPTPSRVHALLDPTFLGRVQKLTYH